MTTRKMLVGYDPAEPDARNSGDFLVPVRHGLLPRFFGLRSGQIWTHGRMVYIGREISENDVFTKLVDSGRRIDDVGQTLEHMQAYLRMLQDHRIGNILTIEPSATETCGFQLTKVASMPDTPRRKLP